MTNFEKLEVLTDFLSENKLDFFPVYNGRLNVQPDLLIPRHRIMVKLSEGKEKDDAFFRAVKFKYHPLFIRDNETAEFVLEKMQNLIIDIMRRRQHIFEKKNRKKRQ